MATFIQKPTIIEAAGQPPKLIEEFVGRVNSGWQGQHRPHEKPLWLVGTRADPGIDEYTVVLRGILHVKLKDQEFDVAAGQAIIVHAGNGFSTAAHRPRVLSTSLSASRRFLLTRCIGTAKSNCNSGLFS